MRRRIHRSGYLMADALIALAIVLILAGVLATAVARQRRGSERLAESRAAVRLAEETLTAMQSGGQPPKMPEGMNVKIRPLDPPAALEVPSGCAWVEVQVTLGAGRSSSLSGLVRADAAKGAMK
ncbi:MAG: hypothetical protein QOF78_4465 [Phycisphaerales bacterium]|jgi:type II secretory pathway pseudopilin PulG|nr:hypothetical protein [Phycisphaerales bacterium]